MINEGKMSGTRLPRYYVGSRVPPYGFSLVLFLLHSSSRNESFFFQTIIFDIDKCVYIERFKK